MTLGIAILGGGIFIQTSHLPALESIKASSLNDIPNFSIKAIWSRSLQSSEETAKVATSLGFSEAIDLYADVGEGEKKGDLDQLLKREDVKAVIIALPITKQPEIIERCWKAGKHVISEKPIGPDIQSSKLLLETYNTVYKPRGVKWRIAENFETLSLFTTIPSLLSSLGKLISFSYVQAGHIPTTGHRYQQTKWRTVPDYQGGFILDGGVHSAAAILAVLSSRSSTTASDVSIVSFVTSVRAHLPPSDTVHSILRTNSGVQGTFELTFGGPQGIGATTLFTIVCEGGWLEVRLIGKTITIVTPSPKRGNEVDKKVLEFPDEVNGVTPELVDFLKDCDGMKNDGYGKPEDALRDLAVIEGILKSDGKLVKVSELLK